MTSNQKMVAGMLAGAVAGLAINKAIDSKLAASKNPGRINKFMRWNLKVGRTWGLGLDAVIAAGMLICDGEREYNSLMKESFEDDVEQAAKDCFMSDEDLAAEAIKDLSRDGGIDLSLYAGQVVAALQNGNVTYIKL